MQGTDQHIQHRQIQNIICVNKVSAKHNQILEHTSICNTQINTFQHTQMGPHCQELVKVAYIKFLP